jgi:hypothetical protein
MYFLKRLVLLAVGAALVMIAETAGAQGQRVEQVTGLKLTPASDAALTEPLRNTYGKVKSIVGRMLTLDVGGRDMSFTLDENTDVLARDASPVVRSDIARSPIASLVQSGDVASVAYRERDGAMRVSAIHVTGRNTIASR